MPQARGFASLRSVLLVVQKRLMPTPVGNRIRVVQSVDIRRTDSYAG